jgi:plastocyanin
MHPPHASATKSQHMTNAAQRPSSVRRSLVVAVSALALATACGGSDDGGSTSAAGGAAGGGSTVTISNFEFAPDTLQVKVGDTVTVENKDSAEHTVTATDNSFDTGRFASGTKTFTVSKAGRFEYVCTVHPFMPRKFIQVSA